MDQFRGFGPESGSVSPASGEGSAVGYTDENQAVITLIDSLKSLIPRLSPVTATYLSTVVLKVLGHSVCMCCIKDDLSYIGPGG